MVGQYYLGTCWSAECNDENNSGVYVTLIPNIALTLEEAGLPHDSEQDAGWFHST